MEPDWSERLNGRQIAEALLQENSNKYRESYTGKVWDIQRTL